MKQFDYVIVGAGAAGCVLAARLTEDPQTTVCLLEAGPPDTNRWIRMPAGFTKTLFDPDVTWPFKTVPTAHTGGRAISTTVGRTLGGSSAINGMIYNRGQPADFDSWAQRGNRGWGYTDVLPYFQRSERREGGDPDVRGKDGAIPVTDQDWIHPVSEAFIAGCIGLGIPRNPDYNSGTQAGVGYFQRTIEGGRRVSAARGYLTDAKTRPNLEIRTNARAYAIVWDGQRAVGVRTRAARDAPPRTVMARREVLVCAGTVNTARLLQLSGIGPAPVLERLGVAPVAVLPAGQNLRDHYAIRFVMRARRGTTTLNELARGPRLLLEGARWALGRPSILGTSPSHVHVFANGYDPPGTAHPGPPNLQCVFTPGSYAAGRTYILDNYPGVTAGAWPHRPESTGTVEAISTDVFDDPTVQPNYLSHPEDQRLTLAGMRLVRQMLRTPELAPFLETETLPGRHLTTDDELMDFARQTGTTTYHLIGTARMGPASDPTSVVDDRLRVHGVQGLRVIDASIMPSMPSANTYASTLMIAERAADFLRGRVA